MKILYVDMDNVLVDFPSALEVTPAHVQQEYEGRFDEIPHIFSKMRPMVDALEAFDELSSLFDTYISRPPLGRIPRPGVTNSNGSNATWAGVPISDSFCRTTKI